MVCDMVVRACVCVCDLSVSVCDEVVCERCCVTNLCEQVVCDNVVCERECVTKLCVCVCQSCV